MLRLQLLMMHGENLTDETIDALKLILPKTEEEIRSESIGTLRVLVEEKYDETELYAKIAIGNEIPEAINVKKFNDTRDAYSLLMQHIEADLDKVA